MAKKQTLPDENLRWYKDAIIYELHIKAFCDSNGDGIGDFGGLLQKLDYLQELGTRMQILLLTCHADRYRGIGHRLNPRYAS